MLCRTIWLLDTGASNCTLKLASYQIRIHDAHNCIVHLRLRSNPIIEHSDRLQFGPYSPVYSGSAGYLDSAGLSQENGLWQQVQDFGWLRKTQSPNW